jgi:predicted transcriptional regulator
MITVEQIRGARAMLRWSARELAERSGVSLPTIQRMEAATGIPPGLTKNIVAIEKALESAGIEFIDGNAHGPGVRFREPR